MADRPVASKEDTAEKDIDRPLSPARFNAVITTYEPWRMDDVTTLF